MTDAGQPPSPSDESGLSSMGPRPRVAGGEATPDPIGDTSGTDAGAVAVEDEPFWGEDQPEPESRDLQSTIRTLIEWAAVAVGALAVALLIKAFLLQAFYIPSPSMEPTLREDDRVLVNKLSYRIGDVQRGDVIVFERPPSEINAQTDDFIKRVIGLEGETVSFSDGRVFIDGQALVEDYTAGDPTQHNAIIPGCDNVPASSDTCVVPDGHVFVLGDNRMHSRDSRFFGPVDEDTIVGRAFIKVWPLGDIGFL
ncbi:MAG: signal peptidase I [Actinomycetota bacterium]